MRQSVSSRHPGARRSMSTTGFLFLESCSRALYCSAKKSPTKCRRSVRLFSLSLGAFPYRVLFLYLTRTYAHEMSVDSLFSMRFFALAWENRHVTLSSASMCDLAVTPAQCSCIKSKFYEVYIMTTALRVCGPGNIFYHGMAPSYLMS